jgi:hypothetical protein
MRPDRDVIPRIARGALRAALLAAPVALALTPPALAGEPGRADRFRGLDPTEAARRAAEEEARKPKVAAAPADAAARARAIEEGLRRDPRDPALRFERARLDHLAGVDGDEDAAERAEEALAALAEERRGDARVAAWLGSARLLHAKRAWAPWTKGALAEEGLALLDDAVRRAPEDLEVRFLRAVSTYALPFFYERGEAAAADFAAVSGGAEAAVRAGRLEPAIAAAALFFHGVLREEGGDPGAARDAWRRAARAGPGTPHARSAEQRLAAAKP